MLSQAQLISRVEAPIDISNIAYSLKGKETKIGYDFKDGKKVRVAKATGEVID